MFQFPISKLTILTLFLGGITVGWLADPRLRAAAHTQEKPASQEAWANQALVERFDQVQELIKPQPGESRWMEIEWQKSLWTARELAAKEGKPIFVWFGSGGSPACPT
jgi:hypothetical protein